MFEFNKLCNEFEKMSAVERKLLLTEKSVVILKKLSDLEIDDADPVETLAAFILGSVCSDGKVNEQEYLLIYPALLKVFGDKVDFNAIKLALSADKAGHKAIKGYSVELMKILNKADESLFEDVIALCLCVTSLDGKVTLKEKNILKNLLKRERIRG